MGANKWLKIENKREQILVRNKQENIFFIKNAILKIENCKIQKRS